MILLISSHLETGHYFNPHAQRIMEAKENGAKLITMDPRLSNTASKSDVWMPTWPGSETTILLAIANYLLQTGRYDREFVRKWVNWEASIDHFKNFAPGDVEMDLSSVTDFDGFEEMLKALYSEFTFERAAAESGVAERLIREAAEAVADCEGRLSAHTWRSASIGNLGGWQRKVPLFSERSDRQCWDRRRDIRQHVEQVCAETLFDTGRGQDVE